MRPAAALKQKASGYERDPFDWYVEPEWAVEILRDHVALRGGVLDPCCGSGTIPKVLGGGGSDIVDRGWPGTIIAYYDLWDRAENIVSNPPYGETQKFLEHFLPITRGVVAVIVRLDFLASQRRYKLFTKWPPSLVIVLSKRPSMPPGDQIEKRGGGQHDYCWIVWDNESPLMPTQMVWAVPSKGSDK